MLYFIFKYFFLFYNLPKLKKPLKIIIFSSLNVLIAQQMLKKTQKKTHNIS